MNSTFVITLFIKAQTGLTQVDKQNVFFHVSGISYNETQLIKKKRQTDTVTRMCCPTITLTARNQVEKGICCMIPFTKFQKHDNKSNSESTSVAVWLKFEGCVLIMVVSQIC